MAKTHGKSGTIRVTINDALVAFGEVKKYSLETSCEPIAANVLGSEWDEHIAGVTSWSAQLEVYFDSADPAQALMTEGQSATVAFFPEGESLGTGYCWGVGTIVSCSTTTENAAIVARSISIKGSSSLTDTDIDEETIVIDEDTIV